ncbi:MAG: methyl-accepting chemotaxis protein [Deltaproteobacteria bacterium]|nr:methyl-accepting chemotaxis protein [Deltaproteobacteria bacterium]
MSSGHGRSRWIWAGVSSMGVGGAVAWGLAVSGHPWPGAAVWAVGLAGALLSLSRDPGPRATLHIADLLRAAEGDPQHPQAAVAGEIRRLLEGVEASGKSIRNVVRHLQEHATLVAWVIDSLNDAVAGARTSLQSMQEAMGSVAEHASEVLSASQTGSSLIETMGDRTEELFQSADTLNGAVEEASSSIVQIHEALSGVQQGVGLLSEASDRTTQFISQVGAAMGAIRERTGESLAVAQKVEDHARQGRDTVARVGRGVEEIRKASVAMVQSVHALGEQSREIEGVLGIITDVAEETSLLSLNAAILAAQAGEKGAAFAVVADQIRSLAHRTRESTKHIEDLIRGIQSNIVAANLGLSRNLEAVEDGGDMGREAVRQLELIEGAVGESVEVVRRIAQAAQEQDEKSRAMVDAAGEVNASLHTVAQNLGHSIHEMDRIQALVQSLAALSEAVHSASEEHRDAGWKTRDVVGSLSTQVEGIHGLLDRQTETAGSLDQVLGQVAESSESTRESLGTIHSIVNDLVAQSDRLQEEVQGLSSGPEEEDHDAAG